MILDVCKIPRENEDMIKCVTLPNPIKGLFANIIYVVSNGNSDWHSAIEAVRKLKETRDYWIEELASDTLIPKDASNALQANVIMPLYFDNEDTTCYLAANEDDESYLKAIILGMIVDARKLEKEVAFASFASLMSTKPEKAKEIWLSLVFGNTGERGAYSNKLPSDYAFFGKGFEQKEESLFKEYGDRKNYLSKFQSTIEGLKNNLATCKKDYRGICDSLSVSEKNELILELAKRIPSQAELSDALDTVVNKGKNSRLSITLKKTYEHYTDKKTVDKRFTQSSWRIHLKDKANNKEEHLHMEPLPTVLYLMNLIYRKNGKMPEKSVDLSSHTNKSSFVKVYKKYFFDENYDNEANKDKIDYDIENNDLIKSFREGTYYVGDQKKYYRGRLKDCYKAIANHVNEMCTELGEQPAPYIATKDLPLTINPDLIDLPKEFLDLEVD